MNVKFKAGRRKFSSFLPLLILSTVLASCGSIKGSVSKVSLLADVSDEIGNPQLPSVNVFKAELSGQPTGADTKTTTSISVAGSLVTHYKYKFGEFEKIDCSLADGYSDARDVSEKISADLSFIFNGTVVGLCVIGGDATLNQWQDPSLATSVKWFKGLIDVQIDNTDEIFQEANIQKTFTVSLSHVNTENTVVKYYVFGSSNSGVDHSLTSGEVIVAAGTTSQTISFFYYDNSAISSEQNIKIYLESADQGVHLGTQLLAKKVIQDDDQTPLGVQSIFTGGDLYGRYGCAILTGNILRCWGTTALNWKYSGVHEPFSATQFAEIAGSSTGDHTCAITNLGELQCWGKNGSGQRGTGDTTESTSPNVVDSGVSYSHASAGKNHTCAITSSGVLKCWGSGASGRLGTGTTINYRSPQVIDGGTNYSIISAGQDHSCGITTAGFLKCWGSNLFDQIGDGSGTNQLSPIEIDSGVTYASVSGGSYHTCAITTLGVLKCWGDNLYGQLGHADLTSSGAPVVIDAGVQYSYISSGAISTCGVTTAGDLKCWGSGFSSTPETIDAGVKYRQVSNSVDVCAVTTSGRGKCMASSNSYNQLGDNSIFLALVPTSVVSGYQFSWLGMGQGASHSCAVDINRRLKCWGTNSQGQLGIGYKTTAETVPMAVDQDESYSMVAVGGSNACGLTTSGGLKCWGINNNGQLGDGSTTASVVPVAIDSGALYAKVSTGYNHSCAITADGVLKCWGSNSSNQLGDGTTTQRTSPVVIDSGTSYASISAGSFFTCGITVSGELKCWGKNTNGQLGDGTTVQKSTPTSIDSGTSYVWVSAGSSHTCGVTVGGELKCWGLNSLGQLGDGTNTQQTSPVVIDSVEMYSSVKVVDNNSCALTTGGNVKCWGSNNYGQVGTGDQINQSTPYLVDSSTKYKQISIGSTNSMGVTVTCGLTINNGYKCWGLNSGGRFGDGQLLKSSTLIEVFRLHDI